MSRLTKLAVTLAASSVALVALQTAPTHAATVPKHQAALVGELGYEGGAYPGGFHPTSGTVQVDFTSHPLVIEKHVGSSGSFHFTLAPGSYTVIGCGPAESGTSTNRCSKPKNVHLIAGQVHHLKLVWLEAP